MTTFVVHDGQKYREPFERWAALKEQHVCVVAGDDDAGVRVTSVSTNNFQSLSMVFSADGAAALGAELIAAAEFMRKQVAA